MGTVGLAIRDWSNLCLGFPRTASSTALWSSTNGAASALAEAIHLEIHAVLTFAVIAKPVWMDVPELERESVLR